MLLWVTQLRAERSRGFQISQQDLVATATRKLQCPTTDKTKTKYL